MVHVDLMWVFFTLQPVRVRVLLDIVTACSDIYVIFSNVSGGYAVILPFKPKVI